MYDGPRPMGPVGQVAAYVFPDGFAPDTVLRATFQRVPGLYTDHDGLLGTGGDVEEIASYYYHQRKGDFPFLQDEYVKTKYLPVRNCGVRFETWLSQKASQKTLLGGVELLQGLKSVSPEDIPSPHGDTFRNMLERLRKIEGS